MRNEYDIFSRLQTSSINERFEVFVIVKIWIRSQWVMMPCNSAGRYKCFGGTNRLHLHSRAGDKFL